MTFLFHIALHHPELMIAAMLIGPPPNRPQGYWGMLNQIAPAPAAAVTVTGSTLPMMGVG